MENFILALLSIYMVVHFALSYSIYDRLKKCHPELWEKIVYRPSSTTEKLIYKGMFLNFNMATSAVYNFCMKKKYLETNDDLLIKLGKTVRRMIIFWISFCILYILFFWIRNLVNHCKRASPEGLKAIWECLVNIP